MKALSLNAAKSYKVFWTRFCTFMTRTLHKRNFPSTSSQVAQYVSYLHYSGMKASSIKSHLSAIAFMHQIHNFNNPTKSFLINKLLSAYSKYDPPTKIRRPITSTILTHLIHSVKTRVHNKHECRLFTSIFTCMYHGALRVSEVCKTPRTSHTLTLQQITLRSHSHRQPSLRLNLSSYKHSSSSIPPLVLHSTPDITCPVKAYQKYLKSHNPCSTTAFHFADGSPVTRLNLLQSLHYHLSSSGYNHTLFNTHSFRIGKATDLFKQGYSMSAIARIGRWRSNAYLQYIKPSKIHTS